MITTAFDHLTASGVLRHESGGRYYAGDPEQAPGPAPGRQPLAFVTVPEAAAQTRLSKATIYRLIEDGTIRAKQIGKSYRIHSDSWHAYLNDS